MVHLIALARLGIPDGTSTIWYICMNMLDPHDIVLYGDISMKNTKNFQFLVDESLPSKMFTDDFFLSLNETLDSKPSVQKAYSISKCYRFG